MPSMNWGGTAQCIVFIASQVGRLEGLESEVDQLQNVLQSVATELESGHQQAQVPTLQQMQPHRTFCRVESTYECRYAAWA